MAVNLTIAKWFVLAPGGLRLMAMRWGLLVLSSLPGIWAANQHLDHIGRQIWFTGPGNPSPAVQSLKLLDVAFGMKMKMFVLLCLLIALAGHQMLTSGAIRILNPRSQGKQRVMKTVILSGMETLWPYLRIVFWSIIWLAAGASVISWLFEFFTDGGTKAGWTILTMNVTIPFLKTAALLLWANLVGAFAHWCRVLTRVDNRKRVRRTVLLVFKSWRRVPFQGPFFYVIVSVFSSVTGALTLFAWRQSPSPGTWYVLWGLSLFFQCFLWFCLARAACVSVELDAIRQIRREPDDPWYLGPRIKERLQDIILKYRIGDRLYSQVPFDMFFNKKKK